MASYPELPPAYAHLLRDPNYGFLGTVRPDGAAQVNPMWFELFESTDGAPTLRFTHTTKRAKFRNLQLNPSMSLAVIDREDPFRYLEVRGRLIDVLPDPDGEFYVRLGRRYGNAAQTPPADSPDRVVLVMSLDHFTAQ
ncbi:PPOX class F420-dependent oxidoreductase [Galbitalea sp. SE-J8]|uniref:PPOX class F420-dependent oxidoreductase n=1 Tax=Galbitalea sp. SE-J8 TaxID=3054952 RepID=UPI00259CBC16|nr:PPOX class F420-dependent oxidoreductase [Galbitalea sp. SE-J8]MDM4762813.1 PPOX class F420-dependent oxidoreductase [Galbitalea sp. SE-J8]